MLCMVKKVFHVNHSVPPDRSVKFQFVKKALTDLDRPTRPATCCPTGCGAVVDEIVAGYLPLSKSQRKKSLSKILF